jgi:hypothetical protein
MIDTNTEILYNKLFTIFLGFIIVIVINSLIQSPRLIVVNNIN